MKKITLFLIILFTINSFSQIPDNKSLIADMNNFYNKGKIEKLEAITTEILSGKYGVMDDELKFYALMYSSNVYSRDEYAKKDAQKGYDKLFALVSFAKNTSYAIPNKETYVKSMSDYLLTYKNKYPEVKSSVKENENKAVTEVKTETVNNNTQINTIENSTTTKSTSDDKTVTLTVSGTGKTLEEARLNALRSAIEQAFGAFISSKTEILNDNVVKDEIVSVTNGNIEKYDIVSQTEIVNNGFAITLNATVSISKLTSFAESKGVVAEFKGGMFAINVKLQKIQEASELIALKNICETSYKILKASLNYSMVVKDPKVIGNNRLFEGDAEYLLSTTYARYDKANIYDYNYSEKFGAYIEQYSINDFFVDFEITMQTNTNFNSFADFFEKSIKSLAISEEDSENRKSLTNSGGAVYINGQKYFLRNSASIYMLNQFVIKSNFIPYFFKLKSNLKDYPFIYKYCYNAKPTLNLFAMKDWTTKANGESINYNNIFSGILKKNILNNEKIRLTPNEIDDLLVFNLKPRKSVFFIREYFKLKEIETIDKFEIYPIDITATIDNEKQRISKIKRVKILNAYGTYPQVYSDFFGRNYKFNNKFDSGDEVDDNGRYVELIEIKNKIATVKIYNAEFQRDSTENNGYEFTFRRTFENSKPTKYVPGELFYIPVEWISDKPVKTNFSENE